MHNFDLHSQRHQHFCNHYAASRSTHPHLLKDQEGISSSTDDPSHYPPSSLQPGFHRHYLAERSATMFNPCTGEIPGFASVSASAAARCHSSYVSGGGAGGGVNRAALYSASYHHFSTFSNSSIPSEENSPTHQHFPLTGSSSSTSHSLSEQTSDNGGGATGSEVKPPLPPKKSRSILKGLLGDLSRDSSQENDTKSNGVSNNLNGSGGSNGHPGSPLSPTASAAPLLPSPSPNLPLNNNTKSNHQSPVKQQSTLSSQTPTSPNVPLSSATTTGGNEGATGEKTTGSNATENSKNTNGSMGKSPQRSLEDDSIDLFMIDPTPLLVFSTKSSSTSGPSKSSPPTSTSSTAAANSNSNSSDQGQQEVKGAEPLVLLVYAASPDVVGKHGDVIDKHRKFSHLHCIFKCNFYYF